MGWLCVFLRVFNDLSFLSPVLTFPWFRIGNPDCALFCSCSYLAAGHLQYSSKRPHPTWSSSWLCPLPPSTIKAHCLPYSSYSSTLGLLWLPAWGPRRPGPTPVCPHSASQAWPEGHQQGSVGVKCKQEPLLIYLLCNDNSLAAQPGMLGLLCTSFSEQGRQLRCVLPNSWIRKLRVKTNR